MALSKLASVVCVDATSWRVNSHAERHLGGQLTSASEDCLTTSVPQPAS
jgi:hypothetical protein